MTVYEGAFTRIAELQGLRPEAIWESETDAVSIWTRPSNSALATRIYISAGIHGDEPCGPEALLRFLELHPLSWSLDWVIAPTLNPSGLRRGSRENADGIDLNRDFFRKQSGEIRALTHWWECQDRGCDLHLSLHEDWETTGFYLYEINTGERSSLAGKILASLQGIVPIESCGPVDGHELSAPGLILHEPEPDEKFGWPEAIWLVRNFPALSITVEAPGRISGDDRIAGLVSSLVAAVVEADSLAPDHDRLLPPGTLD